MLFKGLKFNITITLFVLLTITIVLSNLVSVLFWQKAMVRSEIEYSKGLLKLAIRQNSAAGTIDGEELRTAITKVCQDRSDTCVTAIFFDSEKQINSIHGEFEEQTLACAREAIQSQSESIILRGRTWAVYSFAAKYVFLSAPIHVADRSSGALVMVVKLAPIYQAIRKDQRIVFVYLLVNVLILTTLGLFRMINRVVKPVERTIRLAHTYPYRDEDHLFFTTENEQSEFGQLNMALNTMLVRIESDKKALHDSITSLEEMNKELITTQKEMVRAEKLASVGRLSAGLAHEIGNPIGIVQGYIELLQQPGTGDEEKAQFAERALSELDRINRLIRQLLTYARSSPDTISAIAIDEDLFIGILEIVSLQKEGASFTIEKSIEPGLVVRGDRDGLRQVFLNCLLNAIDAIASSGRENCFIRVIASKQCPGAEDATDEVLIQIIDNGIGIEPGEMEKVFDPFYTTKETGKGTGLGLFVSHQIVAAHRGRLWLENVEGGGVTLNITLPIDRVADHDG